MTKPAKAEIEELARTIDPEAFFTDAYLWGGEPKRRYQLRRRAARFEARLALADADAAPPTTPEER